MQQWQLARGFKQDHDSSWAVMRVHEGDGHPCHLYRAVQGHNLEPPQGHLQALVYQARCDGRAVDGACQKDICCYKPYHAYNVYHA